MITIYKYLLKRTDTQELQVPKESTMLTVLKQHENLVAYFICNPNTPTITVTIEIWGTGHKHDSAPEGKYVTSIMDGAFVWHIFTSSRIWTNSL